MSDPIAELATDQSLANGGALPCAAAGVDCSAAALVAAAAHTRTSARGALLTIARLKASPWMKRSHSATFWLLCAHVQEKKVGGGADFLEEGSGDFNGQGLVAFLEENGYQCAFGRGHLIGLLEMLCLTPIGARFMGVVWHVPSEPQHDFTEESEHIAHLVSCCRAGHWLGASYEHSSRPFAERRWFLKESMGSRVEVAPFSVIRAKVEHAHQPPVHRATA